MSVHSSKTDDIRIVPIQDTPGPPSMPLYISALIVIQCGLLAVNLILSDIGFSNLTMGLVAVGVAVSYISRKQNVAPKSIEIPALLLCVFLAFMAYFSDRLLPFLAPSDMVDDRAKGLAVMLTWLLVFWSFALTLDGAILFCCVPVVAIFGLVGHMTTDPALLAYFSAFIAGAAFMLVHENFLSRRRRIPRSRRTGGDQALLLGQLQVAAICGFGALLVGKAVTPFLEGFGSRFQLTAGLVSQSQRAPDKTITAPITFSEDKSIDIGTKSATQSDRVVMRVRADLGTNWRGATFNEYNGRSWRNTLGAARRIEPEPPRPAAEDVLGEAGPNAGLPEYRVPSTPMVKVGNGANRVKQEVELLNEGLFTEVYAAPEFRIVKTAELGLTVDMDGSIHFPRGISNTRYLVESEIPNTTPDRLRMSKEVYPPEIAANYIRIQTPTQPEALSQIRQAASSAIAGKTTQYDKVEALQDLVAQQGKYNIDASAYPAGVDVTSYFLFAGHQGDCKSFATALAVLCRSVGIPSRVASGFLSGVLDPGSQQYFVREKDKHLWTEIYFANVGWVPFDATSVAEVVDAGESDAAIVRKKGFLGLLFQRGILPPLALLLFCAMLCYVFKVEVVDRFWKKKSTDVLSGIPLTNIAVVEAYEAVCKLLGKRGIPRPASETPSEYLERVIARLLTARDAVQPVERLTPLLLRYRYGREIATDDDVKLAQRALLDLRQALRSVKRLDPDSAAHATAKS